MAPFTFRKTSQSRGQIIIKKKEYVKTCPKCILSYRNAFTLVTGVCFFGSTSIDNLVIIVGVRLTIHYYEL